MTEAVGLLDSLSIELLDMVQALEVHSSLIDPESGRCIPGILSRTASVISLVQHVCTSLGCECRTLSQIVHTA